MLIVRDGTLSLERAGRKGDLDLSWHLDEIADIRMPATYEVERVLLKAVFDVVGLLLLVAGKKSLVRVSVMLPWGEVQDAIFPSVHGQWIAQCEGRLRDYLRLIPDADKLSNFHVSKG